MKIGGSIYFFAESALYTPRDGYYKLPSVLRAAGLGGPDDNPVLILSILHRLLSSSRIPGIAGTNSPKTSMAKS